MIDKIESTKFEMQEMRKQVERDCRHFKHLYDLAKVDGIPQRAIITDSNYEAFRKREFCLYMSRDIIDTASDPLVLLFQKTFGVEPVISTSWRTLFNFDGEMLNLFHGSFLSSWINNHYMKGREHSAIMILEMRGFRGELEIDNASIGRKRNSSSQRKLDVLCPDCYSYDIRHEGLDDGTHWNGWRPVFSCGDCKTTWESGIDGSPYIEFAKNKPLFDHELESHYPPIVGDEGWEFNF